MKHDNQVHPSKRYTPKVISDVAGEVTKRLLDESAATLARVSDTARRADRWRMRDQARLRDLQPLDRVRGCGKPVSARVALLAAADGAHASGVQTCGSVWCCPVCAPVIRQARAEKQARAINRWNAEGNRTYFVTLTVDHHRGHTLDDTRKALMKIWDRMHSGRRRDEIRAELRSLGNIRAVDLTHGQVNGWHPHFHCVFFVGPSTTLADMEGLLRRWMQAASDEGRNSTRAALDVQACYGGDQSAISLAMYSMKAGMEMFRMDLKRSGAGDAPWQLLAAAINDGDMDAARLWAEYCKTMQGKRAAQWSRDLLDWFGEEEQSDEELAVGVLVDATVVGFVSNKDWRRLRQRPGACSKLLDSVADGTLHQVAFDLGIVVWPPDSDELDT